MRCLENTFNLTGLGTGAIPAVGATAFANMKDDKNK